MRLVHLATPRRSLPVRPFHALTLGLCLASLCCLGCTRNFFRQRADKEVDRILIEKDKYPQWAIEQYHVYPDPRARFADPTNPDRHPMPPDDPAAKKLSPNPQKPKHAGIAYIEGAGYLELLEQWNAENRSDTKDPGLTLPALDLKVGQGSTPAAPAWRPGLDERLDDAFRIGLDQSSELGLINSREYQTQRESLYLTALPVTLERFNFTSQWFATEEALRERTGRDTPEGPGNHWVTDSNVGFTRRFATGALLLVRFANLSVFEFANNGTKPTISESILSFDLFQPLLRGGGRAVTLEPLTQAERDLLYEIRRYARFRKEFYVAIAGGGNVGGGANVPAGFENLDLTQQAFQSNAGYLPVILRAGQLANELQNLIHLEEILRFFQAFSQGEGSDLTPLQVDQVEQQLLETRSIVLDRMVAYGSALDRFKIQLGLPTNIHLDLDDDPLRNLSQQLRKFVETFNEFKAVRKEAVSYGTAEQAEQLRGQLRKLFAEAKLVLGTRFQKDIPTRWTRWEALRPTAFGQFAAAITIMPPLPLAGLPLVAFAQLDPLRERLEKLRDEHEDLLDRQTDLEIKAQTLTQKEQDRLDELAFEIELGRFERALRLYETQPWREIIDPDRRLQRQGTLFRDVINQFELVLGAARTERILQIRQGWPDLPPVQVAGVDLVKDDLEESFNLAGIAALNNRLDLMNARAELVDAWRQITVSANALLGVFNVRYHADLLSPIGEAKPLALGGSGYRHQLFLTGELPLTRLPERNVYRATLIAFQRERRRVMSIEDRILADVRSEVRQLRNLAENYKIAQRAVELAYFQVENSLDTFQAPPRPDEARGGAASAAALTQQLLNALRSLPRAQNQLYNTWVQYQITRLQLFRDIELMSLDNRGVWIDDLSLDPTYRPSDPTSGPSLPQPRELDPAPPQPPAGAK